MRPRRRRLEILNLSWCVAVDDDAPLALGECCQTPAGCHYATRRVADTGIDACQRLPDCLLDVSARSQVTDYAARGPWGSFPMLQWRLHADAVGDPRGASL